MTHTYRTHYFHLIWSTKNRKSLIHPDFRDRLFDYMGGIVKQHQGNLLAIGGMPNHVHLLINLSNIDQFSQFIKSIKGGSSYWVHQTIPSAKDFGWQEGYGSFSVSYSKVDTVINYIHNQEEHHKTQTFENEFIEFLKKHHISYDERFVFD